MLSIWLRFKRWLRSLLLALAMHAKINWAEEVNELVDIANDALDKNKVPPLPEPTPTPQPPTPEPERRRRRRSGE